jgi:23S rRNA G2445 N2-methylase RlmL
LSCLPITAGRRARGVAPVRRAALAAPPTEVFLARSIHGLEWLAAAEIETDLNASVRSIGHREITFQAPLDAAVLALGSIDDLFLLCGKIDRIGRGRLDLARLAAGLGSLPLLRALERIERLRPIRRSRGFEVIGSFLGRRNFNRSEMEICAGSAIAEITAMPFCRHEAGDADERDLSWRIHLRDGEAVVALRVAQRPLHRRGYRVSSMPGALHPPVAYAMNLLSGAQSPCHILDPCCGSGTLLIEARRLAPDAFLVGSDIHSSSLRAAAGNGLNANCRWVQADLGYLPYRDGFADCVLANLPWGRTVAADGGIRGREGLAVREAMRVLAPGGNAVFLTPLAQAIAGDGCALLWSIPIRLAGYWASIQIVSAGRDSRERPACLRRRHGRSLQRMWASYGLARP